jgi:hypothetical protein
VLHSSNCQSQQRNNLILGGRTPAFFLTNPSETSTMQVETLSMHSERLVQQYFLFLPGFSPSLLMPGPTNSTVLSFFG